MNRSLVILLLLASACSRSASPSAHEGHAAPPATAPLAAHAGHAFSASDAGLPAGYAPVTLDQAQTAAVGVRLVPVEHRHFERTLRTTGVVGLDETRTSHVHAKVRGWVDTLHVDFVGKKVQAGQPLCSISFP